MKTRLATKDVKFLLLSCAIIAVIPLTNLALKPRPLEAASLDELTRVVQKERQDDFVNYWQHKLGRVKNTNDFVPRNKEIETYLQQNGVAEQEAAEISQVVLRELNGWPVLAERGFLRGQPVWIVAGSSYQAMNICRFEPAGKNQIYEDEVVRCCSAMHVVAVSTEPPYRLIR